MTLPSALHLLWVWACLPAQGRLAGYRAKSLRWRHKATSRASVWEEIGGWGSGPGLRCVGIRTVSAPTSEPGVGRRVVRTID